LATLIAASILLAACGDSGEADDARSGAGGARLAGSPLQLSICVTNNTSGTLQGTPARYADKGEGEFRAEPGRRACVDGASNYTMVDQRVLSEVGGPAWRMKLSGGLQFGLAYGIEVCDVRAQDNKPLNADLVCGGNEYRFSGTVTGNRSANRVTAEYTFTDR